MSSSAATMTLHQLMHHWQALDPRLTGEGATPIVDVTQDSRRVQPGALFVARAGKRHAATDFVQRALAAGAAALLCEHDTELGPVPVPVARVRQLQAALGIAAEAVHGFPTRALQVAAVTGTNGKTTVCHLLAQALRAAGARPALLGTLGYSFEGQYEPTELTTPQADDLARFAATARDRGATHWVMEASSVALETGRLGATEVKLGIFSNLTPEHLDVHRDMMAYGQAKARLFLERELEHAVIGVDGEFGRELAERTRERGTRVTRVVSDRALGEAEIAIERTFAAASGTRLELDVEGAKVVLTSGLIGRHNAQNLALAWGAGLALRLPLPDLLQGLQAASAPPGRLEPCHEDDSDVRVFVDYAHTPDALSVTLRALREVCGGQLICVFGCGGDRDRTKRAPMGRAVGELADRAVITSDNPRSEAPRAITEQIRCGIVGTPVQWDICVDRAQAIEATILGASAGDVVLIAGKGHETYQLIGSERLEFDDREHARRALSQRKPTTDG